MSFISGLVGHKHIVCIAFQAKLKATYSLHTVALHGIDNILYCMWRIDKNRWSSLI